MKIAIVVNSFPKLSETFVFNHVTKLIERGHDVTVIAHAKSFDNLSFDNRYDAKIHLILLNDKKFLFKYILSNILLFIKFFRLVKDNNLRHRLSSAIKLLSFEDKNWDIIHFEFSGLAIQYLSVIEFLKAKSVVSFRGTAEKVKPLNDQTRQLQLKQMIQKVDLIHCVSEDMYKDMEKYGLNRTKAFINYPSINPLFFKRNNIYTIRDKEEKITIISVGRLSWYKGYNYAILAIKQLVNQGFLIDYQIIGNGEEKEHLEFICQKLELTDSISFLGNRTAKEIQGYLEKADIFLLPSVSEGISNAALEGMSMELPIISTRAGGMEEVVGNDSGVLVDLFKPDQIADKIIWLIQNPNVRLEMGKKARERVLDSFSIDKQIDIFEDNYQILFNDKAKNDIDTKYN